MASGKPQKQLTLFVDFFIDPNRIEEFKEAHRPVWAACAKEPECLLFDVFQDPAEPGRFRFVEVWSKDREYGMINVVSYFRNADGFRWFEKYQLTKPYYETLWEKSEPTYLKERQISWFEREGEGCSYRKAYLDG